MNGVLAAYVLSFAMAAVLGLVSPLVPVYAVALGATQVEIGVMGAIGAITYILGTGTSTRIGQKFSVRAALAAGVAFSSASAAVIATTHSKLALLAAFSAMLYFYGFFWPSVEVYLASEGAPASMFSAVWSVGMIAGSIASGPALTLPFSLSLTAAAATLAVCAPFAAAVAPLKSPPVESRGLKRYISVLAFKPYVWLCALVYGTFQGIFVTLYPAYADIIGVWRPAIGWATAAFSAARTVTFAIARKICSRVEAGAAGAVIAGAGLAGLSAFKAPLPIYTLAAVAGVGSGLMYMFSITALFSLGSDLKHEYSSMFESTMSVGYLIGPLVGGFLATYCLAYPYYASLALGTACALLMLKLYHGARTGK